MRAWSCRSFPFKFYGKTYEQVLISTNGLLRFTGAYDWDAGNTLIPRPEESQHAVIAALWTDLDLTKPGAVIRYRIDGQPPHRLFVVTWLNVAHYNKVGAVTFQIVLEESTHKIYINYQDTEFGAGTRSMTSAPTPRWGSRTTTERKEFCLPRTGGGTRAQHLLHAGGGAGGGPDRLVMAATETESRSRANR